ncbi:MAG: NUDIX hydrolase [Tepidanaerobacteraceae bacterium]|nr:NUDIX domain-containing protein [Thermoanaerobacterales bacterium]
MKICFFKMGVIPSHLLDIAVICTIYDNKWVFVKNKGRNGWEMPAGHREENEDINDAASRELCEETGAVKYFIKALCDYSVISSEKTSHGRLFYGEIYEMGELNDSEVEKISFFIDKPLNLVFPEIQSALFKKATSMISP